MIAWTAKTIKHLNADLGALRKYQHEVAAHAQQYGTEERVVKLTMTQDEYALLLQSSRNNNPNTTHLVTLLGIPFEVEAAR